LTFLQIYGKQYKIILIKIYFLKLPISSSELLPLVKEGAFWEVYAFTSHIYLPNSSDSSYPVIYLLTYF